MYRAAAILICALFFSSSVAAQQPCTTNARQVVRELYRHMLERQPDAAGVGWVQQLENGRMTVRDVVRAIASSPEYTQRFIYPEAGERIPYERSVARLYRHVLGRQADPEGLQEYAALARQSGPQAVVDRLVTSREYSQRFGAWGVPGSGGLRYCPPNRRGQNTSGWIEPIKWSATVTTFNRLDLDNDKRLSQDESASRALDRDIRTLPMTGQTVVVEAWERWTDTGINVQARDLLLFEANGTIRIRNGDRNGATADGAGGHRSLYVPMLAQRAGALIGRIGHGPPFFVGSSAAILSPTIGRLYVGVNDDDFRDNAGYFEVVVTIQ
jgi:hypothetical protein